MCNLILFNFKEYPLIIFVSWFYSLTLVRNCNHQKYTNKLCQTKVKIQEHYSNKSNKCRNNFISVVRSGIYRFCQNSPISHKSDQKHLKYETWRKNGKEHANLEKKSELKSKIQSLGGTRIFLLPKCC